MKSYQVGKLPGSASKNCFLHYIKQGGEDSAGLFEDVDVKETRAQIERDAKRGLKFTELSTDAAQSLAQENEQVIERSNLKEIGSLVGSVHV